MHFLCSLNFLVNTCAENTFAHFSLRVIIIATFPLFDVDWFYIEIRTWISFLCHVFRNRLQLLIVLRLISDKVRVKQCSVFAFFCWNQQKLQKLDNRDQFNEELQTYDNSFQRHQFTFSTLSPVRQTWVKRFLALSSRPYFSFFFSKISKALIRRLPFMLLNCQYKQIVLNALNSFF